jgi:hypothetical protein
MVLPVDAVRFVWENGGKQHVALEGTMSMLGSSYRYLL